MSHSVPIKTEFRNEQALCGAFQKLGFTIRQNTKMQKTYYSDPSRDKVFELVAINPNSGGYDVGIVKASDGSFTLECDFFSAGRLSETLGISFAKLKQKYAISVTEQNYESVTIEETFEDGSFIIVGDDGL